MKRTKFATPTPVVNIPDVINADPGRGNFTIIPNHILRNPQLSFKAKGMLAYLLSNKDGWKSNITALEKISTDGESSVSSGLQELEQAGYFLRVSYRNKQKRIMGSFWCYSSEACKFDIRDVVSNLQDIGMECFYRKSKKLPNLENLNSGFLKLGFLKLENQGVIILIYNKTKNINNTLTADFKNITVSMFDIFWKLYPRKIDKGKAFSKWKQLCTKPAKDRPNWKEIKRAIISQRKSERWQDEKFIPHPTTWLNQNRWMDDAEEMKGYTKKPNGITTGHRDKDPEWLKEYERQPKKQY